MKFLKGIATAICTLIALSIFIILGERVISADAEHSQPKLHSGAAVHCEQGTPVVGKFFIKGNDINFRTGPSNNSGLVINQKGTQALGKTLYRTLWTTTVLKGRCETAEWLQARIIEAEGKPVTWEIGWVHKQYVSSEASDDMKAGLYWLIDFDTGISDAEKALLRSGALKVLKDEENCARVTYGYRSSSRKGTYYVTCDAKNDGVPFNVWFTPEDAESDKALAIPAAYPEVQSRRVCEQGIKTHVVHPSTLDIHHFIGYATKVHNNGNRTVIQEFSAKNAFGLKLKYRARCLIQPDSTLGITISEVQ